MHRHDQTGHGGSEHIKTLHTASPQKSRTQLCISSLHHKVSLQGRRSASTGAPVACPIGESRPVLGGHSRTTKDGG